MNARELRTCLIVIIAALVATVHIQLFAVFYVNTDDNDMEDADVAASCYRNIQVTLMRNTTSSDLLAEWRSVSADDGRLLAVPRNRKNYMSVGCVLSGATASTTTTALSLLSQLVNHTSLYHKLHSVVVVMILSDVDRRAADEFVEMIADLYLFELNIGFIHVLQPPRSVSSPPSLSRTSSRQISAMSLLSDYVSQTSSHYLHLGDVSADVIVPRDYMDSVRDFVQRETRRRRRLTTWTLLEFSSPITDDDDGDFLGYFLHSSDLHRVAAFYRTFDVGSWNHTRSLQRILLDIVTQRASLFRRPPIFRRRLDEVFEADIEKPWPSSDDPSAMVLSSMRPVGRHTVDLVYASGAGYFQSASAAPGDWIAVIFETEVQIQRVLIRTGLPDGSQTLKSGFIELSPRLLKLDAAVPNVICADFIRVGEIDGKSTELDGLSRMIWGRPTRCLRLTVGELGESTGSEVVFHQIAVFT